ncbi:MAG: caspase family protein [Deltaproteobacteria bacterium]|nr:caspase family protein [Deltaproteobacteria bacterium]
MVMQLVGVSIFLFSAAQPAPPRLVVQTAAYPVSLAASPDGRFLAAEDGGGIRLWDLRSGLYTRSIVKPHALGLSFSDDGKRLLATDNDSEVFDVATGESLLRLPRFFSFGHFVRGSRQLLLCGRKQLQLWDAERLTLVREVTLPQQLVIEQCELAREANVILARVAGAVLLLDPASGATVSTLPQTEVVAFSLSESGKLLAIVQKKGSVVLVDLGSRAEVKTLAGATASRGVFADQDRRFVAIDQKQHAVSWDIGSGAATIIKDRIIEGEGKEIELSAGFVARVPSGVVLSAPHVSRDPDLGIWIRSIQVRSADGLRVLGRAGGIAIPALDAVFDDARTLHYAGGQRFDTRSAARVKDGDKIILTSARHRARVLGEAGSATWIEAGGERRPVTGVDRILALSESGARVIVADEGGLFVADTTSLGRRVKLALPAGFTLQQKVLNPAQFSPDGTAVLVKSKDSVFELDAESGAERFAVRFDHVLGIAYGKHGAVVCAASPGNRFALHFLDRRGAIAHRVKGTTVKLVASADGAWLAYSDQEGEFRLVSGEDGQLLWQTRFAASVGSITFSPDGSTLAVVEMTGVASLRAVDDGRVIAHFLPAGPAELVTFLPEGYYFGSRQALRLIGFGVGARAFPFEQFDLRFNRPDLVLARLGGATPQTIEAYARAHARRLERMGFSASAEGGGELPELEIVSPLPTTTREAALRIEVRAIDAQTAIDRINLFINDVPVFGSEGRRVAAQASHDVREVITAELLPGRNRLQISAHNVAGVESFRETAEVTLDAPPKQSNLYVLAIGVSDYPGKDYDLTYAAKDARDIAAFFERQKKRFGKVFTKRLLDGAATRDGILAARGFLEQARAEDEVVLFIAGHGLLDERLDYFFATADVDFAQPAERGLPFARLERMLDGIAARKKLALVDTCYSGEVDQADVAWAAAPKRSGAVRARAVRGMIAKPAGGGRSTERLGDVFVELRRGSGAAVIASASGLELALESDKWRNGVFTFSVLEGLSKLTADRNKDGRVSSTELRDHVAKRVFELSEGRQRPTARREHVEFDFDIY